MTTEKLLVRGDVIEGIEGRTEDLRVKTSEFDKQAKRVRCAMCVEHCKAITCLVIVIVVRIIISNSSSILLWQSRMIFY